MNKIITTGCFIFLSLLSIECNDSATGDNQKDTTTDVGTHKIVTEGGLKDSLAIGTSDTTKQTDSPK